MLTLEMLNQNPFLLSLTDEQKRAITEMSSNDENTVIGARIGQLHGQYDTDIFGITGITKNQGEKSYDYAKRVLKNFKDKATEAGNLKKDLGAANAKIAELQGKLEKSADDEIAKQLRDAKARVTQLQSMLTTKESEYKTGIEKLERDAKNIHIDYAFKAATAGLKFKEGLTENIQAILLKAAKDEVLAKGNPDFIDVNGEKRFVLRTNEGITLNNPKNNLNPYTLQELLMETSLKDSLDLGKAQPGGGTRPNITVPTSNTGLLDLAGIKTQVDADKAIEKHLLTLGMTRDSGEFYEKFTEIRSANNVSTLPIR